MVIVTTATCGKAGILGDMQALWGSMVRGEKEVGKGAGKGEGGNIRAGWQGERTVKLACATCGWFQSKAHQASFDPVSAIDEGSDETRISRQVQ